MPLERYQRVGRAASEGGAEQGGRWVVGWSRARRRAGVRMGGATRSHKGKPCQGRGTRECPGKRARPRPLGWKLKADGHEGETTGDREQVAGHRAPCAPRAHNEGSPSWGT